MTIWYYDCDLGQGVVEARTEASARKNAILNAGRDSNVRNVRKPTRAEITFRKAMKGRHPGDGMSKSTVRAKLRGA